MRKKPKVEDLFIGSFVLLAFLYPFIITFVIEMEERGQKVEWTDKLRITSLFVAGLEECTTDRAVEVAKFFDRRALQELGGVDGLLRMCLGNKTLLGASVRIEEELEIDGSTAILRMKVYGNKIGIEIKVSGKINGEGLKITGIEIRKIHSPSSSISFSTSK